MGSSEQEVGRGREIRTGDIRGAGSFRVNLGEVLNVCRGVKGKKPNVRAVKGKILDAGGESDRGGGTPSNMINTDLEGYTDAI
jgi:hypothetical protein